jgi:hypothetical protein
MATQPAPRHLAAARRLDSDTKSNRAAQALTRLKDAGHRVTFARVAREARVSTWFLYNTPELTVAVRNAIEHQASHGIVATHAGTTLVSAPSIATDLALAREEIRDLRTERDRLKDRLRLSLGAELDAVTREELLARIADLEQDNATLRSTLDAETSRADAVTRRADQADADLSAARLSLRRMVRQENDHSPARQPNPAADQGRS